MVPIPITRGNLTLFRNRDIAKDTTANNPGTQSTLTIDRTRSQQDTYQPLLSLCSEARAETVGSEVFQLSIGTYDLPCKLYSHLLRTRLPGSSSSSGESVPPGPVFDGATRDLILIPPPEGADWYTGEELLGFLAHIFGRNVRRIYLHDEPTKQWYSMVAEETCWSYLFNKNFGSEGLDGLIEDVFPRVGAGVGGGRDTLHDAGEFEDQEAKFFGFRRTKGSATRPVKVRFGYNGTWEPTQAQDKCYGEVVRHYRGGRTMVNKGLNVELKETWGDCPTPHSQCLLEQVAQLAGEYFPHLESVSILTLLRQV
jgi:hypothetical protein